MDRCDFFCSLSQKPILTFGRILVCGFFAHMPPNPLAVFFRLWIPSGSMCSLFGDIFWVLGRDFDLSFCEGIFDADNAKGKNIHPVIHPDCGRYSRKYFGCLDERGLGAPYHWHYMGLYSPVLFPCRNDRLLPSQKKDGDESRINEMIKTKLP